MQGALMSIKQKSFLINISNHHDRSNLSKQLRSPKWSGSLLKLSHFEISRYFSATRQWKSLHNSSSLLIILRFLVSQVSQNLEVALTTSFNYSILMFLVLLGSESCYIVLLSSHTLLSLNEDSQFQWSHGFYIWWILAHLNLKGSAMTIMKVISQLKLLKRKVVIY